MYVYCFVHVRGYDVCAHHVFKNDDAFLRVFWKKTGGGREDSISFVLHTSYGPNITGEGKFGEGDGGDEEKPPLEVCAVHDVDDDDDDADGILVLVGIAEAGGGGVMDVEEEG